MKFGWIGIVTACAVYCAAWTSGILSSQTWTPDADSDLKVGVGPDPAKYVSRSDVVWSMRTLLWPDASHHLKDGPWDSVYRPLSQAEIDDLLVFWNARRELHEYENESWDCDNFALEFYYLATAWNMRIPTFFPPPPPVVGIALIHVEGFYPLWRTPTWDEFNHAINVIQRDDGQWLFFEPQNGKMLPIEEMIYSGDVETIKIIL